jgi:hypothetical protein
MHWSDAYLVHFTWKSFFLLENAKNVFVFFLKFTHFNEKWKVLVLLVFSNLFWCSKTFFSQSSKNADNQKDKNFSHQRQWDNSRFPRWKCLWLINEMFANLVAIFIHFQEVIKRTSFLVDRNDNYISSFVFSSCFFEWRIRMPKCFIKRFFVFSNISHDLLHQNYI